MINKNLTMECMVPQGAISENKIFLVVDAATILAKAVAIFAAEDRELILSAPLPNIPETQSMLLRFV
jgi:hypothetical protein